MRRITRRELLIALGAGAFGAPPATGAQQKGKLWRIGFLGMAPASVYTPYVDAFKGDLRSFGYTEGSNIVLEYRWAEGNHERLPHLESELVRMNMDVI